MKRTHGSSTIAAASLLLFSQGGLALDLSKVPAGRYAEDSRHALISFTYTHFGFSNPMLRFNDFDIELDLDKDDVTRSTLTATIRAASVDTGVAAFDEHLTGSDFFNVAEFPAMNFVATSIRTSGDNALEIQGDLTMMGQTHPVTFVGTVNGAGINPINEKPTIGVSLRADVTRSEWGLGKYAPAVSDEVTISLEVEMQKQ